MNTAALTLVATLLGVLIGFAGNFLIQRQLRSWQREQWILDGKEAEWKELIGTLCQDARCMLDNSPLGFEVEKILERWQLLTAEGDIIPQLVLTPLTPLPVRP
jgi:hypothetical protein